MRPLGRKVEVIGALFEVVAERLRPVNAAEFEAVELGVVGGGGVIGLLRLLLLLRRKGRIWMMRLVQPCRPFVKASRLRHRHRRGEEDILRQQHSQTIAHPLHV